ncbi:tetratricopeptide repeat protein [Sphingobacterium yanglingense]|uniref:Uncharacterized protein n=1 Tax=Sphingobacterium yanglingense TaxID=1437280 RepID=A0A4R6WM10_9SPHI|nr:hypothetical protein [Sphingobacterium yanglingense]TDQ79812.1 hypothetical protein CLV99_1262 [Sphingobacterium yanglingense]
MRILIRTIALSFFVFGIASCIQEREHPGDIRMLPKYGGVQKSKEQLAADQDFLDTILSDDKYRNNNRLASDELIKLGFDYLNQEDVKTAMYRFNQAYLIDSTNTDIYWGFGAVYMKRSMFDKAKEQYEIGLKENPKNTHLLTDLGSYYMVRFQQGDGGTTRDLDQALRLLEESYEIDDKDRNTLIKLSMTHLLNNNCKSAWKYYRECEALGGLPMIKEYIAHLQSICTE